MLLSIAPPALAAVGIDFKQAANNETKGTVSGLGNFHWINSIVQSSNSIYSEGMLVPQRVILKDMTSQTTHTLIFTHQWTKGGTHAYDWLDSWEHAATVNGAILEALVGVTVNISVNSCGLEIPTTGKAPTFASVCADLDASPHFVDVEVPDDPYVSKDGATQLRINNYETAWNWDRTIRLRAPSAITSATLQLAHSVGNGADTGDSYVTYTLTWTTAAPSTTAKVEMAGHLAVGPTGDEFRLSPGGWGTTAGGLSLGSSQISGGPYHFTASTVDGASLGSQDNQIKGGEILPAPVSTLEIMCSAEPTTVCQGGSTTLSVTASGGTPPYTFTWSDGLQQMTGTEAPFTVSRSGIVPTETTTYTVSVVDSTFPGQQAAGPCSITVTVNPPATANAGDDITVCASSPEASLNGSVGGGATSGTWSGGTGSFNPDANTLNATYTPSAEEIEEGSVTLTLTTNDPDGPCGVATDQVTITIDPAATASAGDDVTVCSSSPNVSLNGSVGGGATSGTWTTSGTGQFSPDASTLNATYIPSAADISAGSVTLTLTTDDPDGPCEEVSDSLEVTIAPEATANAGDDVTVCASDPEVTLNGSVDGGATSGTWSGGTGTFNPNANTLNATYTPSAEEISAGTVTLTLTTNDPVGPCEAASDTITITINPVATADAGGPYVMCASDTSVQLTGSVAGAASSGTWTTSGTGTFSPNASALDATYIPSAADIAAGSVTLTLTTNDPDGPCGPVESTAELTIRPNPVITLSLGDCQEDGSSLLTAGVDGNPDDFTFLWSTGGTGQSITVSAAGTYSVTVTHKTTGCSAQAQLKLCLTPESSS